MLKIQRKSQTHLEVNGPASIMIKGFKHVMSVLTGIWKQQEIEILRFNAIENITWEGNISLRNDNQIQLSQK